MALASRFVEVYTNLWVRCFRTLSIPRALLLHHGLVRSLHSSSASFAITLSIGSVLEMYLLGEMVRLWGMGLLSMIMLVNRATTRSTISIYKLGRVVTTLLFLQICPHHPSLRKRTVLVDTSVLMGVQTSPPRSQYRYLRAFNHLALVRCSSSFERVAHLCLRVLVQRLDSTLR